MKKLLKALLFGCLPVVFILNAIYAQTEQIWQATHLTSFNSLQERDCVFLNERFVAPNKQMTTVMSETDFPTSLRLFNKNGQFMMQTLLADGNPMHWQFKIINDTTAEWYHLSCDCNIGLESAIFGNMPNPYNKKIAMLRLKDDATIQVVYTENFQKEILDKTSFSNAFFLQYYYLYLQK